MRPAPVSRVPGSRNARFRVRFAAWHRADRLDASGVLTIVLLLHVAAFGLLIGVEVPLHHRVENGVFGVGLGLTAYTYGLRHAFDADHIAAIDNTPRKLRGEGGRSTSVGFWFAMGHSTIVAALAALVAGGAGLAATLTEGTSSIDHALGLVSRSLAGGFLHLIGVLNLLALAHLARMLRKVRTGALSEQELEAGLTAGGLVRRLRARLNRTGTRPWQMYLVGLLFGLGFDTATEVSLLVLAGSGAAQRLPWFAIMTLPLLFAAGMSLLDSLDGMFTCVAYDWAFLNPVRKIYSNLSITGLSVAVALVIGSIELVGVLHDQGGWRNTVSDWGSGIRMNEVGFIIAGLFVVTWALAVVSWRALRVEEHWTPDQVFGRGRARMMARCLMSPPVMQAGSRCGQGRGTGDAGRARMIICPFRGGRSQSTSRWPRPSRYDRNTWSSVPWVTRMTSSSGHDSRWVSMKLAIRAHTCSIVSPPPQAISDTSAPSGTGCAWRSRASRPSNLPSDCSRRSGVKATGTPTRAAMMAAVSAARAWSLENNRTGGRTPARTRRSAASRACRRPRSVSGTPMVCPCRRPSTFQVDSP